nr:MAG TPA: hypothetical protein [Bacteriophage sp.]
MQSSSVERNDKLFALRRVSAQFKSLRTSVLSTREQFN